MELPPISALARLLLATLACLPCLHGAELEEKTGQPLVTVPRLASAPTVDGNITEAEWNSAAPLDGFSKLDALGAPTERTRAWIGHDKDCLFIAVRCWMQPGSRPVAEIKESSGPVFLDDCIEVMIDPLKAGTAYHFAGNSISVLRAALNQDASLKAEGVAWVSRQTDFGWEGEMCIPFKALGRGSPEPGEKWGLLLGRSVQTPKQVYSQWSGPMAATWHEPAKFGTIVFGDKSPVVNLTILAAFGTELRVQGEIQNVEADSKLSLKTRILKQHPASSKGATEASVMVFNEQITETLFQDESDIHLTAGKRLKLASPVMPDAPGFYTYEITLADQNGETLFRQAIPLEKVEPITVKARRYPEVGLVAIDYDLSRIPKVDEIASVSIILKDGKDAVLWEGAAEKSSGTIRFPSYGALPVGRHKLTVQALAKDGSVISSKETEFNKAADPAWRGNNLGREETVIPPWTPVEVSGNKVTIWGRTYEFGSDGLPVQIHTKDRKILEAPWKLAAKTEQGDLKFKGSDADFKVTQLGDTRAKVVSRATAGDWSYSTETTIQFDGFAWTEITLHPPKGGRLQSLRLELALAKQIAKYRLPVFNDPVGIPAEGIRTKALCDYDWVAQKAIGVYWLGDEECGLAFQAETDVAWLPKDRDKSVSVIPGPDKTEWICHLQDDPGPVEGERKFGFAWLATPVKPLVDPYRPRPVGDGWYPANPPLSAAKLADHFAQGKSLGVKQVHTHEPWTEIMGYPFSFLNMDQVKDASAAAKNAGIRVCLYSHPIISTLAPEFEEWGNQFALKAPPVAAFQRTPAQDLFFTCHDTEWSDFYLHSWVRLIKEYGVGGMYFDGTSSPMICTNPYHRHAVFYPDGTVAPYQPIRAAHDFTLRLRRATLAADPGFFFLGHGMTPFSGYFLDYFMTGENFWFAPQNFEVPLDYMRVVLSPQWGMPRDFYRGPVLTNDYIRPIALAHGYGVWSAGIAPTSETAAWRVPIWKAWDAFGIQDAEFVPYWKGDDLVTSSNPDVVVSSHRKKGSVLLAPATTKRSIPSAELRINVRALGITAERPLVTTGDGLPIANVPPVSADGFLVLKYPEAAIQGVYIWIRNEAKPE
jgi:hypothetical protein